MGSSPQNSSGVHWCRRQIGFNEVPEKVPKVPEKVWEALVQSQVTFNRVPEKIPEKVHGWCRARSGSQGSGKGCGEGRGGCGAEPGQVQQGSGEDSGEGARLVQSQVRFNRALHHSLPDLHRNLFRNPVNLTWLCTNRAPSPESSPEPC